MSATEYWICTANFDVTYDLRTILRTVCRCVTGGSASQKQKDQTLAFISDLEHRPPTQAHEVRGALGSGASASEKRSMEKLMALAARRSRAARLPTSPLRHLPLTRSFPLCGVGVVCASWIGSGSGVIVPPPDAYTRRRSRRSQGRLPHRLRAVAAQRRLYLQRLAQRCPDLTGHLPPR
jgi:hypothetical protein